MAIGCPGGAGTLTDQCSPRRGPPGHPECRAAAKGLRKLALTSCRALLRIPHPSRNFQAHCSMAAEIRPLDVEALSTGWFRPSRIGRWVWAFIALGVAIRLVGYLLRFPLWVDECMLAE